MNLRSLDLNLLVVFDRLMHSRSVTATARMLDLTQSSVSAALNRLRAATGDRLLERQGNVMVPTRTALAIWPELRTAIALIEASLVRLDTFDPRTAAKIRVGCDEYTFIVLGQELVRSIRREAPLGGIEVLPLRVPDAEDALNEGTVDVALGASWTPMLGLRVDRLFDEQFTCIVDVNHPTIRGTLTIDAYLSVPHLLASSIGRVPGNVDDVLIRKGLQRRIGATVPYLLAAPQLLAGSDMIFHAGRRFAARVAAWYPVKLIEPPIRIPSFSIAMIWHPRNTESAAHRWLREQVLATVKAMPAKL